MGPGRRTKQAVHSIQLTKQAVHSIQLTKQAVHSMQLTKQAVNSMQRPYSMHVISRQKGRVGTWPARQAKTSIGTRSEGQEERFVQKEINQGEGPIELGQVHGEEEVVVFLSLIWIVVDYIFQDVDFLL